jgi:hypothetical protein
VASPPSRTSPHAKEIQKFNAVHTVDDKRKHLESYEDPTPPTAANSKAAAAHEQAQTDADFQDEAFQRALRDMQQSSKPTQLTKANAAAAAAAATLGKRARTDDEATKQDKPKATSAQPGKRNTMALSFAVDDDGDD